MKYFLRVFFVFALTIFINFPTFALKSEDILLKLKELSSDSVATFEIKLPEGWKLAKAPEIVSKSGSAEFKYQENFKKILENKYETRCKLNKNRKDILKFDFFVCKDICSVVSKDFLFNPATSLRYLIIMIIFGFIGGLLLNVMPCVLPVILLKIKYTKSRETVINSIVGNYLSFLLLASVLSLLKLSGETVGWGLHFQNVYFLKFTVVFFFILSLISFGRLHFHWNLDTDKLKFLKKGIPILSDGRNKLIRDVIYSMVTTLVAIPCTAPLLGTAAAFAVQESVPYMFLIFTAIATGFSFPYFLVLFFKSLFASTKTSSFSFEGLLKKPVFNKIINFGILITFIWLSWILFGSITSAEIIFVCSVLLISFVLFGKNYNKSAILLLIFTIFVNSPQENTKPNNIEQTNKFAEISELVEQNNIVILNITADWCLSCKYNKTKFQSEEVQSKIKTNNVKFVEIDITKRNDAVMNFIRDHSRVGIPFTVIFGPKNKSGIVLSEIPTVSEIVKTIDLVK
ncbi:MAG: thioredoxin family protein [Alphaproteobacteria bacterium]|nr:thioredoxin family protein [Alphaproteobacteria bacterium]